MGLVFLGAHVVCDNPFIVDTYFKGKTIGQAGARCSLSVTSVCIGGGSTRTERLERLSSWDFRHSDGLVSLAESIQ